MPFKINNTLHWDSLSLAGLELQDTGTVLGSVPSLPQQKDEYRKL